VAELGVLPVEGGARVALPAPSAERVELCVFAEGREVRHALRRRGEVHEGFVEGLGAGALYGFRAHGPGLDPAKLLLDPWARRLDTPLRLHPSQFARGEDTAAQMPRCVAEAALTPSPGSAREGPEVIYELHVKGFTAAHPGIPEAIRGTFAGLAHPEAIAHLMRLGVTTVELMPCAAWCDERHLPPLGLGNYWGYNPVALLAPDPRLAPGGMAEVRAAVAALKAAGLSVILDVVLNHTGESDEWGPTLSLRGLGERDWYRFRDGRLANDAGCGNTLALDRPWPLRLAMDALRHWAEQAGLDGFRLDLAATLGRCGERGEFDALAPFLQAMRQDPVLRRLRIIAEPWDIGEGGHRLGSFPAGWGEWNDRYRDAARRFWRGDAGMLGEFTTRLAGSADIFAPPREVRDSVNFVTAHDGFTLADLVSFTERRNHANGEENRDGTGHNLSWNCGAEGPTEDAAILARRKRDVRALLATLLLSRGTPMLSMGDEIGRTQGGNNNAYAQDSPTAWMGWEGADEELARFVGRLVRARLAHPALHGARALSGEPDGATGLRDAAWSRPDGGPPDWGHDRALLAVLAEGDDRVAIALNAGEAAEALRLPQPRPGRVWRLLADSADFARDAAPPDEVEPRSVLLLAEEAARASSSAPDDALLRELSGAAGISTEWHEISGRAHRVPVPTLRALLVALRVPHATAAEARESLAGLRAPSPLPPCAALLAGAPGEVTLGQPGGTAVVALEDGGTLPVAAPAERGPDTILPDGRHLPSWRLALPQLPPGRHTLHVGDRTCHVIAAPARAVLPEGRIWGITAQTWGLRRAGDQGIGDFTALADLARRAGEAGAAWVGLSPTHALPRDRERASPYQPSHRGFLEPMLIDVSGLPGFEAAAFAALSRRELVHYAGVWAAKRRVLHAAWRAMALGDPDLARFTAEGGEALERFARHAEPEEPGFAVFQQWLADRQLAEAARAGAGLYRDLALGPAPDGAEVAANPELFLPGFSMGAPPDPFAPQGQVWGLPPPDPLRARETGHAHLAFLLRQNMRHAAALRMDHVMALTRLFLVPEGAEGSEGAYLAQPFAEQFALLRLMSARHNCAVVGEDLGTVPAGFGEAMQEGGVLSYRVLPFMREGAGFLAPAAWPEQAAACVSTHDLPPVIGWRRGVDIAEREALGLPGDHAAERAARAAEVATLDAAIAAASFDDPHGFVAATPCRFALVQAEDLAEAEIGVNLPGTDRERPNWRRRLATTTDALLEGDTARRIIAAVRGRGR
jgi:glycogen operon protein